MIPPGVIVSIDYKVRDAEGALLEESPPGGITYVNGAGKLMPAVERRVANFKIGDTVKFEVPPEEAYGVHDPELVITLPRVIFPENTAPGDRMLAIRGDGSRASVTIVSVGDLQVTVDLNHPLVGKTLHFEVYIKDFSTLSRTVGQA